MSKDDGDYKIYREKLEDRLKRLGVKNYEFIRKSKRSVHTLEAADGLGIPRNFVSKNLTAKLSKGGYFILILPGDKTVDKDKVKEIVGRKWNFVPFSQSHSVSGYPPGGTPSIGFDNPEKLEVILDEKLAALEEFYCGGGSPDYILKLRSEDVKKFNNARIHNVCVE